MLIKEPAPRDEPGVWSDCWPLATHSVSLRAPIGPPQRSFLDVLQSRQSSVGSRVQIQEIADLLWYAMAPTPVGRGRAGMPVEHRPYPSFGGLCCVRVLVVCRDEQLVALYEPREHRLDVIEVPGLIAENNDDVALVLGHAVGCTLRFVGDLSKAQAAYTSPETLLLREAGGLSATIGLCAEWLSLRSCPLGSLGSSLCDLLGNSHGLIGLGGIQISSEAMGG